MRARPTSAIYPPDHPGIEIARSRDPWGWCLMIPALFALAASVRLTVPGEPFFDEIHYLPAARDLVDWWNGDEAAYRNREHPMLGKALIALGIAAAGDTPLGWRIMPFIAGTATLGASMRALWHATHDRFAVIAFGVLLTSGFHLFVQARIAMLDVFMAMFLALAAWQFAAAIREPESGRSRVALTGVAIGCALASKWNAVPLAVIFGLAFLVTRLAAGRRRPFTSCRGAPIPGISLVEAFAWLGLVPLAVYAFTFAPAYALGTRLDPSPLAQGGMIGLHAEIMRLQQQVIAPHSYQSTWDQWVLNTRGIWYLYEHIDGAQRGVLLIGNPLTMLLGLPALGWCLWTGLRHGDWARLGVIAGYVVSLGLWLVAPKPVQFYYHYLMPSVFLLAALALALSDLHAHRRSWWAIGVLAGSLALFALFFPILSAAPLEGPMSFADWTWIAGWR